jgi:preprotein translocase subunit SecG
MYQIFLIIHICVCVGLIGFVLIQHGRGADMGAAFGGGASQTLFGSTGSANFLSRTTAILATLFFATSFGLSYIATKQMKAQNTVYAPQVIEIEKAAKEEEKHKASSKKQESDVPEMTTVPETKK